LKIYIPSDLEVRINKKSLFLLVRPFYSENGWSSDRAQLASWFIEPLIELTKNLSKADLMLIPFPINFYFNNGLSKYLLKYNRLCNEFGIKAFGFIAGDFGKEYIELKNIIYFRMGGFRSQLSDNNLGFPPALSDHYKRLFSLKDINIRKKNIKPVIGFCGHANSKNIKKLFESSVLMLENIKRFINKPMRRDYEKVFASGYNRSILLDRIKKNTALETNFIYRKKYRGGSVSESDRKRTTIEFYNNIYNSDYIFCLRGRGNFSIRLYETLMLGRIPVLVNTDCLLPFSKHINWKDHVVLIEWEDRNNIAEIIENFHKNISGLAFEEKQKKNRLLWKEKFTPNWILHHLLEF
jgi:hypothetical protein